MLKYGEDDYEQPDRPPECEWCGGKGCDFCTHPDYAGIERDEGGEA